MTVPASSAAIGVYPRSSRFPILARITPLCLTASNSAIDPATPALRLSALPGHGDARAHRRRLLEFGRQPRALVADEERDRPAKVRLVEGSLRLAAQARSSFPRRTRRRPRGRRPPRCSARSARPAPPAAPWATRRRRRSGESSTCSTPAAAALRRSVPTLPGSCRSSRARQKPAEGGTGRPDGVATTARTPAGDSTPLTASKSGSASSTRTADRSRALLHERLGGGGGRAAHEELRHRVPRLEAGLDEVRALDHGEPALPALGRGGGELRERLVRGVVPRGDGLHRQKGRSRWAMASRTGPKLRRWMPQGPSARSASRCSGVG